MLTALAEKRSAAHQWQEFLNWSKPLSLNLSEGIKLFPNVWTESMKLSVRRRISSPEFYHLVTKKKEEVSFQGFIGQSLSAHLDQFTGHYSILNSLIHSLNIDKTLLHVCVCLWELKHKKFDLPFLPCRIPSSTPSPSETRNLDSFCLKPAENTSEKRAKRGRGGEKL